MQSCSSINIACIDISLIVIQQSQDILDVLVSYSMQQELIPLVLRKGYWIHSHFLLFFNNISELFLFFLFLLNLWNTKDSFCHAN